MDNESKPYNYDLTVLPSAIKIIDFKDNVLALHDYPFNYLRVYSDQNIIVTIGNMDYKIKAGTIENIHNKDQVFYSIKVENESSTDSANVEITAQKTIDRSDTLANKILTKFGRFL